MKRILFALLMSAAAACSAGRPSTPVLPDPEPVPDSVVWNRDNELAPVLRRGLFTDREKAVADRLAEAIGAGEFIERLAAIAEDSTNPWVVRANALRLLADYPAVSELIVFSTAMRAREERLRMTAVSGMANYLLAVPQSAVRFLEHALSDPSPRIQARALELLGDRDVDVLRRYYQRATNEELRGIARDLIRVAEERGARLPAQDAAGTLQRTAAQGVVITFRPTQRWPQWDAAVGELYVQTAGGTPVRVAANVEVVGGVVPAFVLPDSAVLVYESNREIRAHSLRDRSDRKLAAGVAPRILPFSNDVIFLRESGSRKTLTPEGTPLQYEIVRMPLSGEAPTVLGQLSANAQNAVKGAYSPVRWMRVREIDGRFYLTGETFKDFQLPTPFGG